MHIVVGSTGGWNAPHARYRLGALQRKGPWPIEMMALQSFPDPHEVEALLAAADTGAVLILQRVMPSTASMTRLREAYDRIIFDFDDAIYAVAPELHRSALVRRSKEALRLIARGSRTASSRKRPLARTLGFVDVCVAGNSILGDFATRYAPRVVEIPTTIEPVPAAPTERLSAPVVVWMGLRANLQYLELVRRPLERLASVADFTLRIVSQKPWDDAPVDCEFVKWSREAERQAFMSSTVGLAPLTDEPWTKGKCAMRSISYGGHGLPVIASPVGITDQVVLDGETGFLASSEDEWFDALHWCVSQPEQAARMGARALEHIRANYSDEVAYRRWYGLLSEVSAAAPVSDHEAVA